MHPYSPATYSPQASFRFPRSYVYWIAWNIYPVTVTNVANVYKLTDAATGLITTTVVINPSVWSWSSNTYSLDFVVDDYYFQAFPGGPHIALPMFLLYKVDPCYHGPGLEFRYQPTDFGRTQVSYLPPQPSGYWVPPPI